MEDLVDLGLGLMVTFGPNPRILVFSWFSIGDGSECLFLVFLRRCLEFVEDVEVAALVDVMLAVVVDALT